MQSRPLLAALISLGCLLSGEVQAASLEISPVTVAFAPGQKATTIRVKNRGGAPAAIQIRAYSWTQAEEEDVLTPTQDIILSPPIFTVPGDASQTIRLLLRGGKVVSGERSYRLLLDEVPAPNPQNRQVAIALRVSLPVIVASASASAAPRTLVWRARRGPAGQILLSATNTGPAYDMIQAIAVTLSNGSQPDVVSRGKNPYILAGAQRHWVVQGGPAMGNTLRLGITTKSGKSEQTLALGP